MRGGSLGGDTGYATPATRYLPQSAGFPHGRSSEDAHRPGSGGGGIGAVVSGVVSPHAGCLSARSHDFPHSDSGGEETNSQRFDKNRGINLDHRQKKIKMNKPTNNQGDQEEDGMGDDECRAV